MKKTITMLAFALAVSLPAQKVFNDSTELYLVESKLHKSVFIHTSQKELGISAYSPLWLGNYDFHLPFVSIALSSINLLYRYQIMLDENLFVEGSIAAGVFPIVFLVQEPINPLYSEGRLGGNYLIGRYKKKSLKLLEIGEKDAEYTKRKSPKTMVFQNLIKNTRHIMLRYPHEYYYGLRTGIEYQTIWDDPETFKGGRFMQGIYLGFLFGFHSDAKFTFPSGNVYFSSESSYFYFDIHYLQSNFEIINPIIENSNYGYRLGIRVVNQSKNRTSAHIEFGKQGFTNDYFVRYGYTLILGSRNFTHTPKPPF